MAIRRGIQQENTGISEADKGINAKWKTGGAGGNRTKSDVEPS